MKILKSVFMLLLFFAPGNHVFAQLKESQIEAFKHREDKTISELDRPTFDLRIVDWNDRAISLRQQNAYSFQPFLF